MKFDEKSLRLAKQAREHSRGATDRNEARVTLAPPLKGRRLSRALLAAWIRVRKT
jgi:hypothetical protein